MLSALLRPANIDASADALKHVQRIVSRLRDLWPQVKILLRADSGFAREELMGWCEHNQVDYLFGLARNCRLQDGLRQTDFEFLPTRFRSRARTVFRKGCFLFAAVRGYDSG